MDAGIDFVLIMANEMNLEEILADEPDDQDLKILSRTSSLSTG